MQAYAVTEQSYLAGIKFAEALPEDSSSLEGADVTVCLRTFRDTPFAVAYSGTVHLRAGVPWLHTIRLCDKQRTSFPLVSISDRSRLLSTALPALPERDVRIVELKKTVRHSAIGAKSAVEFGYVIEVNLMSGNKTA